MTEQCPCCGGSGFTSMVCQCCNGSGAIPVVFLGDPPEPPINEHPEE